MEASTPRGGLMSYSKTIIIGNLGGEPELKYTQSGTAVCNFPVATTETWIKDGSKTEEVTWHRIVVWGKQAENCNQYLRKGSKVMVDGRLKTRSWDDEKTGVKKYATDLVANTVQFLNSNKDTNEAIESAHQKNDLPNYNVQTDVDFAADDIPF